MRTPALLIIPLLIIGCGQKGPNNISFREHVQPILNSRCVSCHGTVKPRGKVVLVSYEDFTKSRTFSGKEPLVVPGSPNESRLYVLCATGQTDFRMPPDSAHLPPLPSAELELIRGWIKQGASNN